MNGNIHLGKQAIVLGGSMAGLLAARVLSDKFDQVTLIERDAWPNGFGQRKGVPQGRHAHALLARGQLILESLFPDIMQELKSHGAVSDGADVAGSGIWHQYGHNKVRFQSGLPGVLLSRPLIEGVVRNRVLNLPNLTVLPNCEATQLLANADKSQVTGVRLDDRTGNRTFDLHADLVIDASGRGSKAPQWLSALGYETPTESTVKVDLGYATRIYPRNPNDLSHIIVTQAPPNGTRGCAMLALEDDRFILTLFGYAGDHPPTDDEGFLEFARSLPTPEIYSRIKHTQALSDVAVHKFPANLRRHYEKLVRMPERYLVIGDAVCSFNPIYGQGMSVSAMEAEALGQVLTSAKDLNDIRKSFYRKATAIVDVPWMLASGADLAYTHVQGVRNPIVNLINAYVARVHLAACADAQVAKIFFEVANLMKQPSALFQPMVILRVMQAARWVENEQRASISRAGQPVLSPATIGPQWLDRVG